MVSGRGVSERLEPLRALAARSRHVISPGVDGATARPRSPLDVVGHLKRCATIDTRTLAVFRVFVGVLVLADLLSRSRNFSFYYTDDGVVTQELAEQMGRGSDPFSLFHYTSDPTLIAGLFVVHGLVAVLLIVGFRSRVMMALTFLFVISLDQHNPLVTSYADTIFRLLLLWAIFLPVGERWSVDAVQRDRLPRSSVTTVFSAAVLLQMVAMYVVNGYSKRESPLWAPSLVPGWEGGFRLDPSWPGGEATPLIMGLDEMTFLLGDTVREVPPILLQFGGITWFLMLLSSPLLFLTWGRYRYPLVAMFFGGHATFALTVRIGAFAYVAFAGLILFLQWEAWRDGRWVVSRVPGLEDRALALYGRLESGGVSIARRFPGPRLGEQGRAVRDAMYLTSEALMAIAVVYLVVFATITAGYDRAGASPQDFVEDNSEGLESLHPAALTVSETTAQELHLGGSFLRDTGESAFTEIWGTKENFAVDQPPWSIFAPNPRTTDRYYVFPALTEDGEKLDVYNERPLTFERPGQELQQQHDAYRERFYMNSIRRGHGGGLANELLAEHICETWPEEHGEELTHVNMYEVTESVTMDTIDDPEERSQTVRPANNNQNHAYHTCGDDVPREIEVPEEEP